MPDKTKDVKKKILNKNEMPHNIEAEQSLLGCLIVDQKVQIDIISSLSEDDFYAEAHKEIFNAMAELSKNNKVIDLVTLADELEKNGALENVGGISYLASLSEVLPSTANYRSYQKIVLRDSTLRKIIRGSSEIIANCQESTDQGEALAFAEKTVFDISDAGDSSTVVKIDDVIPDVMMKMDLVNSDKNALRGIRTKYKGLDNLLDGLHKSDLIVLAARPGVGKTSFAMNVVGNVAMQGFSCAVFSLEMNKEQIVQRLLCSVANVSMAHATRGEMNQQEWARMARAKEILSKAKIFIDDSALTTPQEVLSKCRRIKKKHGLDLIMIDYIQLMTSGSKKYQDNRQQEITEISRSLKILAKETNVPVIALSQLSRAIETRKGRPQLSDLRESGAIEQDADIVMFIHRPDKFATPKEIQEGKVKQNVAELIVEKHRSGAPGFVELYFKGECTKFLNIDADSGEIEDEDNDGNIKKVPIPNEPVKPVEGEDFSAEENGKENVEINEQPKNDGDMDKMIY